MERAVGGATFCATALPQRIVPQALPNIETEATTDCLMATFLFFLWEIILPSTFKYASLQLMTTKIKEKQHVQKETTVQADKEDICLEVQMMQEQDLVGSIKAVN